MTTDKLSLSQLASTWWQRSWGLVGDWSSWGLDHVVYRPSFIESSLTCVPSPIRVLCFCAAIVSRIPLFFLVPRYELPASQEPFIARLASKEERRILFGCMFFNHFIVFLSIHTIIPLCILFIKIRCNYMQVYIYIYISIHCCCRQGCKHEVEHDSLLWTMESSVAIMFQRSCEGKTFGFMKSQMILCCPVLLQA